MSKMQGKRKRRIHSHGFRADTVQLVHTGGRSIGQVACELGLAQSLVWGWVNKAEVAGGRGFPMMLTSIEKEELSRLGKEVKALRMEREILKRAFIAKEDP